MLRACPVETHAYVFFFVSIQTDIRDATGQAGGILVFDSLSSLTRKRKPLPASRCHTLPNRPTLNLRTQPPRSARASYSVIGFDEYSAFLIATSRGSPARDTPFRLGIYPYPI